MNTILIKPAAAKVAVPNLTAQAVEAKWARVRELEKELETKSALIVSLKAELAQLTATRASQAPNPYAAATRNLSAQAKLERENPTLAKQLRAAAISAPQSKPDERRRSSTTAANR